MIEIRDTPNFKFQDINFIDYLDCRTKQVGNSLDKGFCAGNFKFIVRNTWLILLIRDKRTV